jgi:predicted nuclease of predicted toxin-antitoxin system
VNLLADENIDAAIVDWLRSQGHDVLFAAESRSGSPDAEILRLSREESCILITADVDFGELTVRRREAAAGVVLLRLRARLEAGRLELLRAHWPAVEPRIGGNLVIVRNRTIRVRPIRTA